MKALEEKFVSGGRSGGHPYYGETNFPKSLGVKELRSTKFVSQINCLKETNFAKYPKSKVGEVHVSWHSRESH
jgi:hypothetical protein